jgi:hypothetical protein
MPSEDVVRQCKTCGKWFWTALSYVVDAKLCNWCIGHAKATEGKDGRHA